MSDQPHHLIGRTFTPGMGRPMTEAPRPFVHILARGSPIRNGEKWPEYVRGDEIVTAVWFSPGFFVEPYGPTIPDRWRIANPKLGIYLDAVEWWPLSQGTTSHD